jgi:hypothetical protein
MLPDALSGGIGKNAGIRRPGRCTGRR